MKIQMLIFNGTPKSFDHDIIHGPTIAAQADAGVMAGEQTGVIPSILICRQVETGKYIESRILISSCPASG